MQQGAIGSVALIRDPIPLVNHCFQVADRPELALAHPDVGGQHLIWLVLIQANLEVRTLVTCQLQGVIALPMRLQPDHTTFPIDTAPIHQRAPTASHDILDRFNRLTAAIQPDGLQPFQLAPIPRRVFRTLRAMDFLFGEGKLSFCHTL
jgi:hypothetical protein